MLGKGMAVLYNFIPTSIWDKTIRRKAPSTAIVLGVAEVVRP